MNPNNIARQLREKIESTTPAVMSGTEYRKLRDYAQQAAAYAEALEQRQAFDPEQFELRAKTMCVWTPASDPFHGDTTYSTTCGQAFSFDDHGPLINGFTHCPFCGQTLTEAP